MKKRTQKTVTSNVLVPAQVTRPVRLPRPSAEPTEPTALTVAIRLPHRAPGKTPGARINAWHKIAVASGKASIAAGIMAGWELANARQGCNHGQWLAWLRKNTAISPDTATRYLTVFAQTVGAARAARPKPVALDVQPTMTELEAACSDVEVKSLTALYGQLRLIKRNANHGGDRREAAAANGHHVGRPAKGSGEEQAEAAELDAIANNPALLYAAIRGPLDELWKLHRERDVFARLGTEELAAAQAILRDLAAAAAEALEARG